MNAQKDAQEALIEYHAMLRGHFDYGDGTHGDLYLNPKEILRHTDRIGRFLSGLLTLLGQDIIEQTEVVAGPELGGWDLARYLKDQIEGRKHKVDRVEAVVIRKMVIERHHGGNPTRQDHLDRTDHFSIDPDDVRRLHGRKTLWVDDVIYHGGTRSECVKVLRGAGADVIATASLYDRISVLPEYELDVPHTSLVEHEEDSTTWPVGSCNLCRLRVPITEF
jgi:orotate phosphoribosyltransferase